MSYELELLGVCVCVCVNMHRVCEGPWVICMK